MSKSKGAVALGDVIITIFGAEGGIVEQWVLNNPFIKSAKFGDLDYSSDDLRTVELSVRYDWATCDTGENDKAPQDVTGKFFDNATES